MLDRLTGWLAGDAAENLIPRYFGFNAPMGLGVCVALLVLTGAAVAWYYWRKLVGLDRRRRIALVGLRTMAIVLALFLVLDPVVVAQHVKPGEQFIALLFDDSLSMRIGGQEGRSRGTRLLDAYAAAEKDFEGRLKRRHQIVRYRVGETAEPLRNVADLDFRQRQSDLTGAIERALADLEGTTVSAVVLFSDGVQLSETETLSVEKLPKNTPIFTVGVDEASQWRDIELTNLSIKRTDFDKSPVVLTVGVHSTGLAGRQAVVEAVIGSRVVKSHLIEISDDVEDHEVRLEFVPDRKDWIEYEARVRLVEAAADTGKPAVEDRIVENNTRRFVVDNRDKQYRILYVSGRPNWQNKFVRMALEEDKEQLRMTSLIAISNAERKFVFRGKKSTISNPLFEGFDEDEDRPRYDEAIFLRLGAGKDELMSGYPIDPAELFKYDLVIWGDVEREFFNTEQLEVTRDFVDQRGGTLLLLGGPNAFTEGRYMGTLIEQMLPVALYQDPNEGERLRTQQPLQVKPTIEGRLTGSWIFDADEDLDAELWAEMPPLYGLNRFPFVRAGATVLGVVGGDDESIAGEPLFALQRYGEGKCAILASGDTWQWQMRLEEEDDRHERFWRQLIRSLVHDTPQSTVLRNKRDAYMQGAEARLEFMIRDEVFDRREGLQCVVTLTQPNGESVSLAVEESIQEIGLYTCEYAPAQVGLHEISLVALDKKGEVVAELNETLLVESDQREFQKAQYNGEFLRELAQASGGAHFSLEQLDELAEAIPVPVQLDSTELLLHLWHLPGFFIALVLLMIPEWYLRRKAGRA